MASAYVQSKNHVTTTGSASPTVTLDNPPTTGNLLVAFIACGGTQTSITISGWSNGTQQSNAGNGVACRAFWRISNGTETTVTGAMTTSRAYGMIVMELSGVDGGTPNIGENSSQQASGTRATGSVTPTSSLPGHAVGFRFNKANTTCSAETVTGTNAGSVNEREDAGTTGTATAAWEAPITSTSGSYSGTWTDSSNANNCAALLVFQDAVAGAPANTVAPAVTGTTTLGATLSTTDGNWTNSPTSFAYQWMQDDGFNPPSSIGGATANTYVLAGTDVGFNVFCTVTATNGTGSTPANSNEVGPIAGTGYTLTTNAFTYLSADGVTNWGVDVYASNAPNGLGLMLGHGGFWQTNTKADIADAGAFFASQGFTCFAFDFTQETGGIGAPHDRQTMIDDYALAIAACRANVTYSSALSKFGMLGESSGGHLAYMVATTKTGTQKPDAVVGWSPPTRFETLILEPAPIPGYIKAYLDDPAPSTPLLQQFSPYNQVTSACCPMRIAGSTNEQIPLGQFDDMYAAALAAPVSDLVEQTYPGGTHARLTNLDGVAAAAWLIAAMPSPPPAPTLTETGGGFVRTKRPSALFTDNMDSDELVAFSLALTSLRRRRFTTGTTSEASKGGAL